MTGFAETANGRTYDLPEPEQKRAMVADGMVYFIDRLREVITAYDPEGLVTMGWFAPYFRPTGTSTRSRYWRVPIFDFFDFPATEMPDLARLSRLAPSACVGTATSPSSWASRAWARPSCPPGPSAPSTQQWIANSCAAGFDGWLNWGYYAWPEDLPGAAWAFLDDDGRMLEALAPVTHPDPCVVRAGVGSDVARSARVTATNCAA